MPQVFKTLAQVWLQTKDVSGSQQYPFILLLLGIEGLHCWESIPSAVFFLICLQLYWFHMLQLELWTIPTRTCGKCSFSHTNHSCFLAFGPIHRLFPGHSQGKGKARDPGIPPQGQTSIQVLVKRWQRKTGHRRVPNLNNNRSSATRHSTTSSHPSRAPRKTLMMPSSHLSGRGLERFKGRNHQHMVKLFPQKIWVYTDRTKQERTEVITYLYIQFPSRSYRGHWQLKLMALQRSVAYLFVYTITYTPKSKQWQPSHENECHLPTMLSSCPTQTEFYLYMEKS